MGCSDQIYKLYVRPRLYYDDIIYHKYDPEFELDFAKKLESIQYSTALAVTGAWRTQTGFAKKLAGKSWVAEVLKQSFQVRGENLTLLDFMEKQTLEKRCFVSKLGCQASISDHDEIIKNSELY